MDPLQEPFKGHYLLRPRPSKHQKAAQFRLLGAFVPWSRLGLGVWGFGGLGFLGFGVLGFGGFGGFRGLGV